VNPNVVRVILERLSAITVVRVLLTVDLNNPPFVFDEEVYGSPST
jgi:hypothetical protein